ncbi:MAG: radical SAM protein [Syntrophobacteraceae bacterium]
MQEAWRRLDLVRQNDGKWHEYGSRGMPCPGLSHKDLPMKFVLINAALPCNSRHKKVLPLGMLYLAAFLRAKIEGLQVAIIDAHIDNLNEEQTLRAALNETPDMVGFGYWTLQAETVYRISDKLRNVAPHVPIIHGGVHPTMLPKEAIRHSDVVVMREAELTMRELLLRIADGSDLTGVKGCAYSRSDGTVVIEEPRGFIEDLDALPFPAWDLVEIEKYDTPLHVVGGRRIPVMGSRGCPYNCSYCGSPVMWRRRVRYRTPENVVGEIKAIKEQLDVHQIHFWDDNLFMNRPYIERLLHLMDSENLRIRWTGLTRASHLRKNADLIPLAKASGCIGMEIGIESANPETFRQIQKNEDLETLLQVSDLQKANGMYPMFTYMAFNPGETIHGYYLQGIFIDSLLEGLPWADFFHPLPFPLYIGQMCTPHPGTKLHEDAHRSGHVMTAKWSDYYHHRVNFIPNSLLDDIPIKNIRRLGKHELMLFVRALNAGVYAIFYNKKNYEIAMICYFIIDLAITFFNNIDGRLTIHETYDKTARNLCIDRDHAYSYLAVITLVMSEMGWITSAKTSDKPRTKTIKNKSAQKSNNYIGALAMAHLIFSRVVNSIVDKNAMMSGKFRIKSRIELPGPPDV